MAFLSDGSYRAAFNAFSAGSICVEEAVGVMVVVWSGGRWNGDPGDD